MKYDAADTEKPGRGSKRVGIDFNEVIMSNSAILTTTCYSLGQINGLGAVTVKVIYNKSATEVAGILYCKVLNKRGETPLNGKLLSLSNGYEFQLNLDGASQIPGLESVSITIDSDKGFNGKSSEYDFVVEGIGTISGKAKATNVDCPSN